MNLAALIHAIARFYLMDQLYLAFAKRIGKNQQDNQLYNHNAKTSTGELILGSLTFINKRIITHVMKIFLRRHAVLFVLVGLGICAAQESHALFRWMGHRLARKPLAVFQLTPDVIKDQAKYLEIRLPSRDVAWGVNYNSKIEKKLTLVLNSSAFRSNPVEFLKLWNREKFIQANGSVASEKVNDYAVRAFLNELMHKQSRIPIFRFVAPKDPNIKISVSALRDEDVAAYSHLLNHKKVKDQMHGISGSAESLESSNSYLASKSWTGKTFDSYRLALLDEKTDQFIGAVQLIRPGQGLREFLEGYGKLAGDLENWEIGYFIDPKYHGKGIGTVMLVEAIRHFRNGIEDPIDTIYAQIAPRNIASQEIARKAGFTELEGLAEGSWKVFQALE